MIRSERLSAKPPRKAASKAAATPKAGLKPFKSAEFIADSDDEDESEKRVSTATSKDTDSTIQSKHQSSPEETKKLARSNLASASSKASKKRRSPSLSFSKTSFSDSKDIANEEHSAAKKLKGNGAPKDFKKDAGLQHADPTRRKTHGDDSTRTDSNDSKIQGQSFGKLMDKRQKAGKVALGRGREAPKPAVTEKENTEPRPGLSRGFSGNGNSKSASEEEYGEESQGGSVSEEDSSREDEDECVSSATVKPQQQQAAMQAPSPPYTPPSGFEAVSFTSHTSSEQTELFSPTSLQGKQIWYITVPAEVSISSLTEVAKQSVQNGSVILNFEGADYGLIAEAGDTETREMLLLPSAGGTEYKPASHPISKTLYLQQLIRPPDGLRGPGDLSSSTAIADRSRYQKPKPQQPEGLRMRYRPFGDTSSDSSLNGSPKQAMQVPQFRVPKDVETASPPKKRKRDELLVESPKGSRSPKKSRKDDTHTRSQVHATLTKGEQAPPAKEVPRKHSSSSKERKPKDKKKSHENHEDQKTTPIKVSTREKALTTAEDSPQKQLPLHSKASTDPTPVINGKANSLVNEASESLLSKPKDKTKKKHRKFKTDESIVQYSQRQDNTATNGNPVQEPLPSNIRSNHDRDVTAGAESPDKKTSLQNVRETELGEGTGPPKKKSKHEGETAEEKAKRKAERKLKHAGETAGEKAKRKAERKKRKALKANEDVRARKRTVSQGH